MRLRILIGVVAVAGVAASSAHAEARPLRPADGAVLKRAATTEERVAEGVRPSAAKEDRGNVLLYVDEGRRRQREAIGRF